MTQVEALNRKLFLEINAPPGTAAWRIDAAILIANGLVYLIPILLAGLLLCGDARRRNAVLRAFVVAMLGLVANQAIGFVWSHPRPFAMGSGHAWIAHVTDSSFPSAHVTGFTGIGISLLFGEEALLGGLIIATGLAVAWARIFRGLPSRSTWSARPR